MSISPLVRSSVLMVSDDFDIVYLAQKLWSFILKLYMLFSELFFSIFWTLLFHFTEVNRCEKENASDNSSCTVAKRSVRRGAYGQTRETRRSAICICVTKAARKEATVCLAHKIYSCLFAEKGLFRHDCSHFSVKRVLESWFL